MRPPIAPIGWSIALHAVLAGLLIFGLSLPKRDEQPVILPIDAVVVDDAVLQAAGRKREDDQRAEVEARKRAAAEAEEKRLEEERIEQEQERQRAEEQAKQEAEQKAAQKAKAEADAKLKAEADAKRKADAKAAADKKRATQEKHDRDAREADLRAKLEEEETRTSAGFQSLKASYVRAIQAHVEQRWYEPPGVAAGLSCTIYVTQIPGGEVTGMRFGTCNGNAAVRQSIETAVRNASPLPAPPEPSLFEREVELVFTPKEN
ncbi:MAG TPA: cell envelope integrity protein TolA [Steroidobacteraceae bacterium]|nr:cell envelope integrity protein TolA [Steroidobacteraceae bacterium]